MKCTNFAEIAGKMGRRLQEELVAAVLAHGGKYVFFDPDSECVFDPYELPVVRATIANMNDEKYCAVTRVEKGDVYKGHMRVFGYPEIYDGEYAEEEYEIDVMGAQDYQNIIEAIPETETVRNVTIPDPLYVIPVMQLDREDIEFRGFKADNMDDETFGEVGRLVRKWIPLDDFWLSIDNACEYLGIPRKDEEPEEDEDEMY